MPHRITFKSFLNFLHQNPFYLILPIWITVQVALYLKYDIKIVYDSYRYLTYADSLAKGSDFWYQWSSIFYCSYTVLLFIVLHVLNLTPAAIILFQIIVSGIAVNYLYKATLICTNDTRAAIFATLLFAVWPDLQSWNFYIHTESLYISSIAILLYLIVRDRVHYKKKINPGIVTLILVISFLRPNGFFLIIGYIASFMIDRVITYYSKQSKYHLLLHFLPFLIILSLIAALMLEVFSPLTSLHKGQVIQGYSDLTVRVHFPIEANNAQPVWIQVLNFFLHQPIAFFKLLFIRFLIFWGQIRPYYSIAHNLLILFFFFPVYFLALRSLARGKLPLPITTFILTVIFLQTCMAVIISVDWDNRFIVPLLPLIFILAASGLTTRRI